MTRLEAFCERLTRAVVDAYDGDERSENPYNEPAARDVAERMVREFASNVVDELNNPDSDLEHAEIAAYLDHPEPPGKP